MLLDETKAALMLGITKELLYAFVKNGAKGKKLQVKRDSNNNFFDRQDLVEWDKFLHEPWALNSSQKPDVPRTIKEYLKIESGGKCCRCGNGHRIDDAHIVPWAESLSHHPHNLIRLCTNCHTKYDDGIILKSEIQSIKFSLLEKIKSNLIVHLDFSFDSLHLIPNADRRFIGRTREIKEVRQSIKTERLTIIYGLGGIGKTELLIHALAGLSFRAMWFSMERYRQLSDFYAALFKVFKSSSMDELIFSLDSEENCLILDGIENLLAAERDAVMDFIKNLLKYSSRAKLIITSQNNFIEHDIKYKAISLSGLPKTNWSKCLVNFIGKDAKIDGHFQRLANYAEGHPLTLRIIAGLVTFYRDTEIVWNKINQTGAKAIKEPRREQQTRATSLISCLSTMYDNLSPKERWLLEYLCHFPGGFKQDFIEILLIGKTPMFLSSSEIYEVIGTLNQYSVLRHETDLLGYKRVYILSPVRGFIIDRSKNSKSDFHKVRLVAFQNMVVEAISLYSNNILSDEIQFVLNRYELDLPNYLHAIQTSVHSAYCKKCQEHSNREDYLRAITGLATGLYKFLFTRGYFKYGIYFNEQGAKAHVELREFNLAIDDMVQVASLYRRMYNHDEAAKAVGKLKEYELKSGESSTTVRFMEAELAREKDPHKAIEIFGDAVSLCRSEIFRNSKNPHTKSNLAALLGEIGKTYETNFNDPKTAIEYYLESYGIHKEINDYANMYCNSHHLGNCFSSLDQNEVALEYYEEALDGFIELGQRQYIGNTLWELGKMRCANSSLNLEFLSADKIEIGLNDIEYEVKMIQNTSTSEYIPLYAGLNCDLVHKLWSIIRLVSLTEHSSLLVAWSTKMIGVFKSTPYSYPWIFLQVAQLACKIERNLNDQISILELKKMCYLFGGEVEHDIYDPYQWLSIWLKERNIDRYSSRGRLFSEIESLEDF
jgi:tetratricopeptide (TPR) repeat protein